MNENDLSFFGVLAEKLTPESLETLTFNFDGITVNIGTTLKVPRERPHIPFAQVDIHVKESSGYENKSLICFDRDKQVFISLLTDYLKEGYAKKYSEEELAKFDGYRITMSDAYRTLLKSGHIGTELVDRK